MKPSSGRAQGVANRAASRVATRAAGIVATAIATTLATASFGLAASFLCIATAHAQVSTATADGTPQIDALIAQKDWTNALTQLDERLKTNPRDVQAKFKRGTVLARLNRDNDAIAAFTELTQAYPELPEPYNNLAALYAKHGRYEEARAALETAIKANPNYALAYDNLGDLYLRLASESYKRAQSLGSKSPLTRQRVVDIQKSSRRLRCRRSGGAGRRIGRCRCKGAFHRRLGAGRGKHHAGRACLHGARRLLAVRRSDRPVPDHALRRTEHAALTSDASAAFSATKSRTRSHSNQRIDCS